MSMILMRIFICFQYILIKSWWIIEWYCELFLINCIPFKNHVLQRINDLEEIIQRRNGFPSVLLFHPDLSDIASTTTITLFSSILTKLIICIHSKNSLFLSSIILSSSNWSHTFLLIPLSSIIIILLWIFSLFSHYCCYLRSLSNLSFLLSFIYSLFPHDPLPIHIFLPLPTPPPTSHSYLFSSFPFHNSSSPKFPTKSRFSDSFAWTTSEFHFFSL